MTFDGEKIRGLLAQFLDDFEKAKQLWDRVPEEKRADLGQAVAKATEDDSDYCASEIIGMIARLSEDPWWEPPAGVKAPSLHLWEDEAQSKEKYINFGLSLMGDRPAASLRYHDILEAGRYHWLMTIRNTVREWMIQHNLLSNADPDA